MPNQGFTEIAIQTGHRPSVDIVVPSLNQRPFLTQTLASILTGKESGFDLTCHVVDGGSTDGSVDLLRASLDPRLNWTSAPDAGQSDAVNRGIARGTGDIIGWLNSDDLYLPGTIAKVMASFADPKVQWVVGRCMIIDEAGREIRPGITRYKNHLLDRFTPRALLRQNCIAQPAVFWRRSFGQSAGPLDTSLHFTMDYDLWLRMARLSPPTILPQTLAAFRVHNKSKTGRIDRRQFDEGYQVASRYFGDDRMSRWLHKFHVEKIVMAYRILNLLRR
jgi:glycosyltransferase involved in cell wall biosynthesis